jgi:hypothetical protein
MLSPGVPMPLKFSLCFLLIASPFYCINLYFMRGLERFLAVAVQRQASVLAFKRRPRSMQEAYYLMRVNKLTRSDPDVVWAEGLDLSLGLGQQASVYYDPLDPGDARVLDGREITRYKADFIYPAIMCNAVFLLIWMVSGEKSRRDETPPMET